MACSLLTMVKMDDEEGTFSRIGFRSGLCCLNQAAGLDQMMISNPERLVQCHPVAVLRSFARGAVHDRRSSFVDTLHAVSGAGFKGLGSTIIAFGSELLRPLNVTFGALGLCSDEASVLANDVSSHEFNPPKKNVSLDASAERSHGALQVGFRRRTVQPFRVARH